MVMSEIINFSNNLSAKDRLKYMLDNGIDIHMTDDQGHTILMYAVFKGEKDIVKQLIDHNVDLEQVNWTGKSALIIASETPNRDEDIIKMLVNAGAKVEYDIAGTHFKADLKPAFSFKQRFTASKNDAVVDAEFEEIDKPSAGNN